MKIQDIITESVYNIDRMDDRDVKSLHTDKFYVFINTLSAKGKTLVGPFDTHDIAHDYMETKVTPHAKEKLVVNGTEARKIAS